MSPVLASSPQKAPEGVPVKTTPPAVGVTPDTIGPSVWRTHFCSPVTASKPWTQPVTISIGSNFRLPPKVLPGWVWRLKPPHQSTELTNSMRLIGS